MRDVEWAQFLCLLAPGILAGMVWAVAAFVKPGQKRFLIRFDLLTLLMLLAGISVVLALSRAARSPTDEIFAYLLSVFILPGVWLIQIVIDGWRDARRKREAEQAQEFLTPASLQREKQENKPDAD